MLTTITTRRTLSNMNTQELSQVRTLRAAYGRMMTNGYSHEQAARMLIATYRVEMSDAVLTRGLWLDATTPDCDPV